MAKEDDLREQAKRLLELRTKVEEEPVESMRPHQQSAAAKRARAGELAKAAVAPGAGIVSLIAILQQLISAHVSPEQMKALNDRVDQLETDRTKRRQTEYERDLIENCRVEQADGYLKSLLPRRDQQVGPPPKVWFDQCPELPEPTTGAKPAPK